MICSTKKIKNLVLQYGKDVYMDLDENIFQNAEKALRKRETGTVVVCDKQWNVIDMLADNAALYGTQFFNYSSEHFEFLKNYDFIISDEVTAESFEFIRRILSEKDMPQVLLYGSEWQIYKTVLENASSVLWSQDCIDTADRKVFYVSNVFKYYTPLLLCLVENEEEQSLLKKQLCGLEERIEIICYDDVGLKEYLKKDYDAIVNCIEPSEVVARQLFGYGISPEKIKNKNYLIKAQMMKKYHMDSDEEIQEVLAFWKKNEVSVYNQYCYMQEDVSYEVTWDQEVNMPYVWFEGKKMYFPRTFEGIFKKNDKLYINNILGEQSADSPHLYVSDKVFVEEGDVVVDAGVCEGNFALRYVDTASKIYLVECDPVWMEALKMTFKDYEDKVVFCNKFLSNTDDENNITLDTLVQGNKVDFIKMDIEGAEVDALRGGECTFANNDIKCAICGYHQKDDVKNIKKILHAYGLNTSCTKGYMTFWFDPSFWESFDFRHGIVHGYKK